MFQENEVNAYVAWLELLSFSYAITTQPTHPDFYGRFAIALTKQWGEDNRLQSVQYINPGSIVNRHLSAALDKAFRAEEIEDVYADALLSNLAHLKPIRGVMKHEFDTKQGRILVTVRKNFHDEREWRYVPDPSDLSTANKGLFLPNAPLLTPEQLREVNNEIASDECKAVHLNYDYKDICYLVVPDSNHREDLLELIAQLPDDCFDANPDLDRLRLASRIRVLSELREDV